MNTLTGDDLAATFDASEAFTVGLEEEVMLLDPQTLDLRACASELLGRLNGDPAFKLELPASQLELVTRPCRDVPAAVRDLGVARASLLEAGAGLARPAAAGVHPFSAVEGSLNSGPRYGRTASEYGVVARSQLICALQIHVAVGGAARTLGVYNALRSYLPELAALASNSPVYRGRVTGLASVRPKISELLPRQGIPPHFDSWDDLARELTWGATAGAVPDGGAWWWELRPHLRYGTLELRVPDAQTTLADVAAIATVAHALVVSLAESHHAGDSTAPPPHWRIEENRWSACRNGVEGALADLETGERQPTRARLHALLDRLEPVADRFSSAREIHHARSLVERNGAILQREVVMRAGVVGLARWLADRFDD
jgi:glutamate---cysteine ligase / carboxylate-amine ligase